MKILTLLRRLLFLFFTTSGYSPQLLAIGCAPDPTASPASLSELLQCLTDFQEYKKSQQLTLLDKVADGSPADLETLLSSLLLTETTMTEVVNQAYTDTLITRAQKRQFLATLTAEFKSLKKLKTDLGLGKGPANALKRFSSINTADSGLDKLIAKTFLAKAPLDALPTVKISRGGSAGFMLPNQKACFLVQGCGALTSSDVTVDNPYSDLNITPILPSSVTINDKSATSKEVCVVMADSQGGGRLNINACGTTLKSPLLFNKGESILSGLSSGGLVRPPELFTGNCSGTYSGTIYWSDGSTDTAPAGSVVATFEAGVVSISSPASGTGRITRTGLNFATGGGSLGLDSVTIRWSGSMWIPRTDSVVNTATARGVWNVKFFGGKASGSWTSNCIISG